MKTRALAYLALVACTPKPELTPEQLAAGAAVRQSWSASELPAADRSSCDLTRFYIRTPSDAQGYYDLCHAGADGSYGCLSWQSTDRMMGGSRWPVVVVSPWWRPEPTIIIHELMHAYAYCSGLFPGSDPGDREHTDPRVWSVAGGADSVESVARSMM